MGLMGRDLLRVAAWNERLTRLPRGTSSAAGRRRATCTYVMADMRRRVATVRGATDPPRANLAAWAIPKAKTTRKSYHSHGVAKRCGRDLRQDTGDGRTFPNLKTCFGAHTRN